jgi:RNA-binding protein 39
MEQGLLGAPSPIPTECLLLKNLFDPTTETEEDWHLDIAEDVKEECGKHGPVDHIFVDKDSRVRYIALRTGIEGVSEGVAPSTRGREHNLLGALTGVERVSRTQGFVYLKFATTQGSMAAQQALNARWFARRMIVAEFQFVAVYNTHFGL